jgi:hypothetical protein
MSAIPFVFRHYPDLAKEFAKWSWIKRTCPYCKKRFITEEKCQAHKEICPLNPKNKRVGCKQK